MSENEKTPVDLWIDPSCPYAWMTSQWLRQVEHVRPVEVRYHLMSLYELNQGRELEPEYRKHIDETLAPARVCAAVGVSDGEEALGRLYRAMGKVKHNEGKALDDEGIREALALAGLDESFALAAASDEYDEAMRKSHHEGMDPVGSDVGTPVLHVPRADGSIVAFFGPVIIPAPTGEAAGRLYDGVVMACEYEGLFELKRTRTRKPEFLDEW